MKKEKIFVIEIIILLSSMILLSGNVSAEDEYYTKDEYLLMTPEKFNDIVISPFMEVTHFDFNSPRQYWLLKKEIVEGTGPYAGQCYLNELIYLYDIKKRGETKTYMIVIGYYNQQVLHNLGMESAPQFVLFYDSSFNNPIDIIPKDVADASLDDLPLKAGLEESKCSIQKYFDLMPKRWDKIDASKLSSLPLNYDLKSLDIHTWYWEEVTKYGDENNLYYIYNKTYRGTGVCVIATRYKNDSLTEVKFYAYYLHNYDEEPIIMKSIPWTIADASLDNLPLKEEKGVSGFEFAFLIIAIASIIISRRKDERLNWL